LATYLLDRQANAKASFELKQQILAMLILDHSVDIATGEHSVIGQHALLFQKA